MSHPTTEVSLRPNSAAKRWVKPEILDTSKAADASYGGDMTAIDHFPSGSEGPYGILAS